MYLAATSHSGGGFIVLAFFVVFFGVIGLSFYLKRKREQAMDAAARQNGWQKLNTNDPMLSNCLPPYLRGAGDSQSYDMAYQANLNGTPVTFFQFNYSERQNNLSNGIEINNGIGISLGSNNSATNTTSQSYSFSVASFQIPQNYGSVLLFRHVLLGLGSLGQHQGMQKITLEGDFNQHFEVFSMPGKEVEALSLLTPDMMAFFVDKMGEYNIHIIGTSVYVVGDDKFISPNHIQELLGPVTELAQQLAHKPVSQSTADNSMSVSQPIVASQIVSPAMQPTAGAQANNTGDSTPATQ